MLKLQESFIVVDLAAPDSATVIQKLAGRLHQAGMVTEEYYQKKYRGRIITNLKRQAVSLGLELIPKQA